MTLTSESSCLDTIESWASAEDSAFGSHPHVYASNRDEHRKVGGENRVVRLLGPPLLGHQSWFDMAPAAVGLWAAPITGHLPPASAFSLCGPEVREFWAQEVAMHSTAKVVITRAT